MEWTGIRADLLKRFWNETSVAMWNLRPDGYAINADDWCALTGQCAEDIAGEGWLEPIHPCDRMRVQNAMRTALANGVPFNASFRMRCADKMYRWFNGRGSPMFDDDGRLEQWVGVILSIPAPQAIESISDEFREDQPQTEFDTIAPGALRAARGLLGWSAARFATAAGLSRATVQRIENQSTSLRGKTVSTVIQTLKRNGIVLLGRDGQITGVDRARNAGV